MTEITFREVKSTRTSAKRGRPEKFTQAMRDALNEHKGETAVIQEGVKSESRATVLKNRYPEFRFVVERHDGFVNILAYAPTAAQKRAEAKAAKAKAEAAAQAETPVEAPAAE